MDLALTLRDGLLDITPRMPPSLPEEILVLILEHLAFPDVRIFGDISDEDTETSDPDGLQFEEYLEDVRDGITALQHACLASKSLHRLAWPILYRALTSREPFDASVTPSNFLRTVCLKPEYGLALRSLSIGDWNPIEAMDALDLFTLLQGDATVVALFQWRAKGFWFGDELLLGDDISLDAMDTAIGTLCRALNMGLLDGHMALLLLMCPNIQDLDILPALDFGTTTFAKLLNIAISPSFQKKPLPDPLPDPEEEESDYIVSQMFGASWPQRKIQKPKVLQHLKSLKIRSPGPTGLCLDFYMNLMSLPSLQFLSLHSLWGGPTEVLDSDVQCTQLRTLELPNCHLPSDELAAILKFCPGLTKLVVVWDNLPDLESPRGPHCLEYGYIGDSIKVHTPLLETLTLDSAEGWVNDGDDSKRVSFLGSSLTDLTHLRRLTIDDHSVYGSLNGEIGFTLADTIPKSVIWLELRLEETLEPHISEDYQYQNNDVIGFLQDESFSRLCRVDLVMWKRLKLRDLRVRALKDHGWSVATHTMKGHGYASRGEILINQARLKAMEADDVWSWQRFCRNSFAPSLR